MVSKIVVQVRHFLRRRTKIVIISLIVFFLACLFIGAGTNSFADYGATVNNPLFLNIGTTLAGVLIGYIIVNNLLESLDIPRLEEFNELPYDLFIEGVENARSDVIILTTWTEQLNRNPGKQDNSLVNDFLRAMDKAIENGTYFKFLLANPNSEAAIRREEQLNKDSKNNIPVRANIKHNLLLIQSIINDPNNKSANIEVRVYDETPTIFMYQSDDWMIFCLVPENILSEFSSHIRLPMRSLFGGQSQFGGYLRKHFQTVWNKSTTLDDYWFMEINFIVREKNRSYNVEYEQVDNNYYIVLTNEAMVAYEIAKEMYFGKSNKQCTLLPIDKYSSDLAEASLWSLVSSAFMIKYGKYDLSIWRVAFETASTSQGESEKAVG